MSRSFDTSGPIEARLHFGYVVANLRVTAEPGDTAEIEVVAADPGRAADQRVAEQTRIEFAAGVLTVRAPKLSQLFGRTGAVDVRLRLPEASGLTGEVGMGEVVAHGRLGDCQIRNGYGDLRLDQAAQVDLRTGSGDLTIGEVAGGTLHASSGRIDVGHSAGPIEVRNSNGSSRIGDADGPVHVNASNGTVTVDRAGGDVTARTAHGRIEIGEVARGTVRLESAAGSVEVGVRSGSAVWLDLNATAGRVNNELTQGDAPADGEERVSVQARTVAGNIVVRRVS